MTRVTPTRTCIGCRSRRPATELIRVTNNVGEPVIDQAGSGRGAWLCRESTCVMAAAKARAFSRAFRTKLSDGYFADTLLGWLR